LLTRTKIEDSGQRSYDKKHLSGEKSPEYNFRNDSQLINHALPIFKGRKTNAF
jgi:hypothetical protein